MRIFAQLLPGAAVVCFLALAAGCDTARPGAGFTTGTDPALLKSEEKPATRTDLPAPDLSGGDESLAEAAASSPATAGNNAGTGGRNAGQGGTQRQQTDAANAQPEPAAPPSATPPTLESSGASGAQGGTKPPENINTGTPRSPH